MSEANKSWNACSGCGYSLAGLPAGGRCPECGILIEESHRLEPPPDPGAYSTAIASGLAWIRVGHLLALPALAWWVFAPSDNPASRVGAIAVYFVAEVLNTVGLTKLATMQAGLGRRTPGHRQALIATKQNIGMLIFAVLTMIVWAFPSGRGEPEVACGVVLAVLCLIKACFVAAAMDRIDARYRYQPAALALVLLSCLLTLPLLIVPWLVFSGWAASMRNAVVRYQKEREAGVNT